MISNLKRTAGAIGEIAGVLFVIAEVLVVVVVLGYYLYDIAWGTALLRMFFGLIFGTIWLAAICRPKP